MADLEQAFVDFVNKVPFYTALIVCLDEEKFKTSCRGFRAARDLQVLGAGDVSAEDVSSSAGSSCSRFSGDAVADVSCVHGRSRS
jgi:UDP-N-acetylmuramate-alanine ligase